MTRFLFERRRRPDGSMPRNSLPNGKLAPDSFNTQLDECAYPLIMALAVGLTDDAYYKARHRAGRRLRGRPRPRVGPRALGGAGWLLTLDHLGGDRRVSSRRRTSPIATATTPPRAVWRGVADEFQRNLKKWTLTTNGPLQRRSVLHPPVEDRRSRTPPSPTTSATAARRSTSATVIDAGFLEYARLGAAVGRATPTSSPRCPSSTRRSSAARPAARLPALQRRRLRRRRARRPSVGATATRAPATRGRSHRRARRTSRPRLGEPAIARLDSIAT